jgi:hypothetical protein
VLYRQCCTDGVVQVLYRRCCTDCCTDGVIQCWTDSVVQCCTEGVVQCCTDGVVHKVFYRCCTDSVVQTVLYSVVQTVLYRCFTGVIQTVLYSVVRAVLYGQCCTRHLWKQPPLHLLGRYINHQFCIPCAIVLPEEPECDKQKVHSVTGSHYRVSVMSLRVNILRPPPPCSTSLTLCAQLSRCPI